MKIVLFITTFNCGSEIRNTLENLYKFRKYFSEIIVLDNRSSDKTLSEAISFRETMGWNLKIFRNNRNYGLGGSHKVAFSYAKQKGASCAILHGDNQTEVDTLVSALSHDETRSWENVTLLGARFITGSVTNNYSFMRNILNRVLNIVFSLRFGSRIYDLGSGLNLYGNHLLESVDILDLPDDLSFNYFLTHRIVKSGCEYKWIPILWRESSSESNLNLVRQLKSTLRLLISGANNFGNDTNHSDFSYEEI